MKLIRQTLWAAFLTVTFMHSAQSEPEKQVSWKEQYAYSMGMAAYPYTLPYLYMSQLRRMWTNNARDPINIPYAAINHFWHANKLADATYKDGGTPNNDTVYSTAWVNVGEEPIILSHPDMEDRNFSFHFTGYSSDNFAVVSQRATGSEAGNYAIVPKGFKGTLPAGVTKLKEAPTPWVLVLVRTMVYDAQDMPNVINLQQEFRLTPLSFWGKADQELPASRDVWAPYRAKKDPLASWRTINRAMTENPPPASETALLNFLAQLHIGPGQDISTLDEDSKRGLARAARDGHKMAKKARTSIPGGTIHNGWRRNPAKAGSLGQAGDYFTRGIIQSFKGISANYPEEARYFSRSTNENGDSLNANESTYELTFAAGQLPPVDAFWSLTMYGMDANLVSNSIDRYSIGDRSPGLEHNTDGSLTLYLQHESPGKDKESNWLPAPDGPFTVTMRAYRPKEEITQGKWIPPNLETQKK